MKPNLLIWTMCALCACAPVLSAADVSSPNIADATNGCAIVRFSAGATNVAALIDPTKRQKAFAAPAKFPQDIVLAFREDREALISKVVLRTDAKSTPADRPRRVGIAVSTTSPVNGFEEVTVASLNEEAGEHEIEINRRAKFLFIRVLDNFGGKNLALSEVKAFEGSARGYVSVLATNAPVPAATPTVAKDDNEPNNSATEAKPLPLGRHARGAIDPATDEDWFRLEVPGKKPTAITFALRGEPNIRTAMTLMRGSEVLKQFDPGRSAMERTEFSWYLDPGQYHVKLSEPPTAIVLIWDSSSSMRGSEKDLQRAVESFLGQVKAPDRVQLIQFSGKVEVLTTNFTSNSDELLGIFHKRYKLDRGTAFFDAVRRGAELLEKVPGNRAIVVMTDGADSQSKMRYADFWQELSTRGIRLYTVGLGKEITRFTDKIGGTPQRMLGHIASASNGKFFFTDTPDKLLNLYQKISDELHSRSSYEFAAVNSRGEGTLAVSATARRTVSGGNLAPLEIIFDASGSMREKIDSRRKIEIMKEVMTRTIDSLSEQQPVALRVFGHRIDSQRPGARTDSELVFPLARIDKSRLRDTVQKLQPRGTTPIAYSLQQLTNDFSAIKSEKQVVLVTDGREEAGGDPIEVVKTLLARGFKFRLNVVGFALGDKASKDQMRAIAEMTGGRFYDATSAAGLRDAVEQSAVEEVLAVPFDVVDGSGATVASGETGARGIAIPEGVFTVRVQAPGRTVTLSNTRVTRNKFTRLMLTREGEEFASRVEIGE